MLFQDRHYQKLKKFISERRLAHTNGVASAAVKIATRCLPERIDEIKVAAMLHDVAKEYPAEKAIELLKTMEGITDDDLLSPAVYHALIAPEFIKRNFGEFATSDILSAVSNHTTGDPNMTVFDEIIFVSDYIEDGRTYKSCVDVREKLYAELSLARSREEAIFCLHRAVILASNYTIHQVVDSGRYLNLRTVATRNAFVGRMPSALK